MTKYKFEANERRQQRIIDANYTCQVCGKRFPESELQLAHIIPKHLRYIKKYGKKVIHHDLNMVVTCSKCNSSVLLNPAYLDGKIHLKKIYKAIGGKQDGNMRYRGL